MKTTVKLMGLIVLLHHIRCLMGAACTPLKKVTDLVMRLGVDDHLLLLISGGGSALLPAPAVGISLEQKIALNDALLEVVWIFMI